MIPKSVVLFFLIALFIILVIFILWKRHSKNKRKETFTSSSSLELTTYYANWAQFWPGGPEDGTPNKNVNSPFALQENGGLLGDTILYGIVMFGVTPNPSLKCWLWPNLGIPTYQCVYNIFENSGFREFFLSLIPGFTLISDIVSKDYVSMGEQEAENLLGDLNETVGEGVDIIDETTNFCSSLIEALVNGEDSTPYLESGNFLTFPMYPNECFTGCQTNTFEWSITGTGSNCCTLHRITDPYCFQQLQNIKLNTGKKLIASYGGWTWTHGGAEFSNISQNKFVNMLKNATNRKQFFAASALTLANWGFDGADFDWEYPGSKSAGANIVTINNMESTTDFYNFECLIREYKQAAPSFILSMQCSGFLSADAQYPGPLAGYSDNGIELYMRNDNDYFIWINRLILAGLDKVHFMAYDYYVAGGQPYTMPNTPLFSPLQENINFDFSFLNGTQTIAANGTYTTIENMGNASNNPYINPILNISNYSQFVTTTENYTNLGSGCNVNISGTVPTPNTCAQVPLSQPFTYKNANGQQVTAIYSSAYDIANAFGIPLSALLSFNNVTMAEAPLKPVGFVYNVPCNQPSVPICGQYTVQGGDYPSLIAQKLNVPLIELNLANPLFQNQVLNPNNVLNIPCKDVTPTANTPCPQYIIKSGDSYSGLAGNWGIETSDLTNLNVIPATCLQVGYTINTPCINNSCPAPYYSLPGESLSSIFQKLFPHIDTSSSSLYTAFLTANANVSKNANQILPNGTTVAVLCNSPPKTPAASLPPSTNIDFMGPNNTATVNQCIFRSLVLMKMNLGANINKVHLGIAQYGRTYSGVNFSGYTAENSIGIPTLSGMPGGSYTQTPGVLSYYEINQLLQQKDAFNNPLYVSEYNVKYGINVAYSVQQQNWISYDGPEAIRAKIALAKAFGVGGILAFCPQQDDFSNNYPLTNLIQSLL